MEHTEKQNNSSAFKDASIAELSEICSPENQRM